MIYEEDYFYFMFANFALFPIVLQKFRVHFVKDLRSYLLSHSGSLLIGLDG